MIPQFTPRLRFPTILALAALIVLIISFYNSITRAQGNVSVTAANPAATEQGTINLNVKVTGKGFKNGAQAKWFVTGTTNPGGVTVNSTTFVSSGELTANITVADAATIANFDIQVTNSDGRGGKGTELFAVTPKGDRNAQCPAMQPAPASDTKCYAAQPGCLDSGFGAGVGYLHTDAYPPYVSSGDEADGVAVQPDGKIVIAGRTRISSTDIDFTLIRYNVDGTLDTSFGDPDLANPPLRRGYTLTSVSTGFDYANALVLQPDGKIVVTGPAAGGSDSVVVRYNSDGTLDFTFGTSGIAHFGSSAPRSDIALQSNGKIIVAGQVGFGLMRLNTNGSLDSSFGSGGLVNANPTGSRKGTSLAWALAIQRVPAVTGEERIVIAGWSIGSNGTADWTLMRFRSNGATDTTFGSSGIVKTPFGGFGDQARRVRIDSSNRIVAAGIVRSASDNCGSYIIDTAVVRYTQDGGIDGTFSGGKQIVDIYGGDDEPWGLAVQTDGKILTAGIARSSDNSVTDFALVRFNSDGTRDFSFGLLGNGVVTTDLYGLGSYGYAMALSPTDGKIIVGGGGYLVPPHSDGQILVARYLP